MTILWLNLIVVYMFALFSRYFAREDVTGKSVVNIRPNKIWVLAALTSLVATSGLRANIGDTFNYRNIYEENDFTWEYVFSQKDYGFGILQMFLKNYISDDAQIMIFTSALITNLLIVLVFYNYSRMIELSLYVYITGGLFLVSMNGIRQVLAAAITFVAIKFLLKGKFFRYTLVVIIASFFHLSALVLIPIYFLVRFRAWSQMTIIVIVISVLAVLAFEQFTSVLFTVLEDTQYSGYETFDEGGSNFLRTVVASAPLVVAYLGRKKLRQIFPESDFIVNMSLLGCVFMLISTQWWIFARVSIYFELYQLILIGWIVKLFSKKDGRILYFGVIFCYLIYFYYEHVVNLNIQYRSDFLTW